MAVSSHRGNQLKGVWVIDCGYEVRYYMTDRLAAQAIAEGSHRKPTGYPECADMREGSARWFGEDGICDATELYSRAEEDQRRKDWRDVQNHNDPARNTAWRKGTRDAVYERLVAFKAANMVPTPVRRCGPETDLGEYLDDYSGTIDDFVTEIMTKRYAVVGASQVADPLSGEQVCDAIAAQLQEEPHSFNNVDHLIEWVEDLIEAKERDNAGPTP
jgi:hypothetical protein